MTLPGGAVVGAVVDADGTAFAVAGADTRAAALPVLAGVSAAASLAGFFSLLSMVSPIDARGIQLVGNGMEKSPTAMDPALA